jgi:hypothetical protein
MDRLESLMRKLRMLAGQPNAGSDATVDLFEADMDEYVTGLLNEIRNAARDVAKQRPNERNFWTSVEEYADRFRPERIK